MNALKKNKVLNSSQIRELIDDVGRSVIQILVVHLLSHFFDNEGKLLSEKILKKLLYVVFAMILYHVIVKKMIIKNKKSK